MPSASIRTDLTPPSGQLHGLEIASSVVEEYEFAQRKSSWHESSALEAALSPAPARGGGND